MKQEDAQAIAKHIAQALGKTGINIQTVYFQIGTLYARNQSD